MTEIRREEHFLQGWALLGFWSASQRLIAHTELGHEAYAAAGEALFWACVCDEGFESLLGDRYANARDQDYEGRVLRGIRWARNRMTHQRAMVLDQHYGAELDSAILDRAVLGTRDHLKWVASDQVPPGRHDAGRDVYDARLGGQPVEQAVEACRSWLLGLALNEMSKAAGLAIGDLPGLPVAEHDTPPNG